MYTIIVSKTCLTHPSKHLISRSTYKALRGFVMDVKKRSEIFLKKNSRPYFLYL